ncbi:Altered inheritance of mitochondria protein 6 [Hypocenomyce scalaris]|nr:Altered inheritance of mitochondria protein 6 [Hypocenomyce scalaris]
MPPRHRHRKAYSMTVFENRFTRDGRKKAPMHPAYIAKRLGIVQCFTLLAGLLALLFPGNVGHVIESLSQLGQNDRGLSSWPTDFTRDINPIPCHSHNDYWRLVPVYSALSAGCISIEADVWLFDEELYVGHSTSSLTRDRTLKSLYIDPLLDILSKQNPSTDFRSNDTTTAPNGVFDTDPSQSLTLLIDFKTAGAALWPYVLSALQPLRDRQFLTYQNGTDVIPGPITVTGTGNTPFDLLASKATNPTGDIFFDAPLDQMWEDREWEEAHGWPDWDEGNPGEVLVEGEGSAEEDDELGDHPWGAGNHVYKPEQHKSYPEGVPDLITPDSDLTTPDDKGQGKTGTPFLHPDIYTPLTSSYASVSFGKAVGRMWRNRLSPRQMGLIRGQIRGAHRRGLKVRYWDTPNWPVGLRNHVWDVLVREGVDLLNVDDLRAVKGGKWGKWAERMGRVGWWWW